MGSEPSYIRGMRVSLIPQPEPGARLLVIDGPLVAADVPRLCERLRALLCDSDAAVVVCDVRALSADALTIEALARMQLTARRLGRRISVQRASCELDALLAFVGLADVLAGACGAGGRVDEP